MPAKKKKRASKKTPRRTVRKTHKSGTAASKRAAAEAEPDVYRDPETGMVLDTNTFGTMRKPGDAGKIPYVVTDECIEMAREMMTRQHTRHTIRKAITKLLGRDPKGRGPNGIIGTASVSAIMDLARERSLKDAKVSKGTARNEALETYKSILRDTNSRAGDIINAQTRIDAILGLEARHDALGGKDADEAAREVRQLINEMRDSVPQD